MTDIFDIPRLKREREERLKEILRNGETSDDDSQRPQGSDTPNPVPDKSKEQGEAELEALRQKQRDRAKKK